MRTLIPCLTLLFSSSALAQQTSPTFADLWNATPDADQADFRAAGVTYNPVDFEPVDLTGPRDPIYLNARPDPYPASLATNPIRAKVKVNGVISNLPLFVDSTVVLRLQDLHAMTSEVVPVVADAAGVPTGIDLATETLASGNVLCHDWTFKFRDAGIDIPITSSTLDSDVANSSGRVNHDIDMPGADATGTLRLHLNKEPASFPEACWWVPNLSGNTDITASVDDLAGELDTVLARSGGGIGVTDIPHLAFSLTGVNIGSSAWFLDAILDLGVTLYDLFDSSCSGLDSCVNEVIEDVVSSSDELVDTLQGVINDAIDVPLSLNGGLSSDGYALDYGVDLSAVSTNSTYDYIRTDWAVELESGAPVSACAADLLTRTYTGSVGIAPATTADMELEAPFSLLGKAAYLAGKQGFFCDSFLYSGNSFSVRPNGAITFAGPAAGDPDNTLRMTLPIKVIAVGGATGTVTGTLTMISTLEVDCDDEALELVPLSLDLGPLAGSLRVGAYNIPASALQTSAEAAVDSIPLDPIELMPQVTDLDGLGDIQVSVADVVVRNNHVVVGLDIGDDTCETAGGGGGGGGGGGTYLPPITPWELDPWDLLNDPDGETTVIVDGVVVTW